ncbi:DUF305 domain-containing protein [Modestobacter excelsi]|uniref:DUF305 domain-containing protein n=1 Tax=Modestobacter excelsi TaxID=2213161 RepID=UPI00110D1A40|nr:DUF305 domain-containing protein [Modestobacter excelsi]
MTSTTARITGLAGALVAGTLLLAGCADDPSNAVGENSTASGSVSSSASAEADHDDADVAFASGMIPHHRSAITMAQLAEDRAADPRVEDLAAGIEAAQAPEIDTMSGWLADWGAAAPSSAGDDGMGDMGGMDHGDMGGMDTGALAGMSGAEFDRMFLTMMIEHHRSAVQMAETEAADGQDTAAIALAESIRGSQTAEIAEMQRLLAELGG